MVDEVMMNEHPPKQKSTLMLARSGATVHDMHDVSTERRGCRVRRHASLGGNQEPHSQVMLGLLEVALASD